MGNPINQTFDATQWAPEQGGSAHPVGKFPMTIVNTEIKPTRDGNSGMFVVEFQSDQGRISMRYNLWNTSSQQAVEIAHKQLSALCHATGIYRVDFSNEGAALRNGRCVVEVGYQNQTEEDRKAGKTPYVEVKRVYDLQGNEPGRPAAGGPQPAQASGAPMGGPGASPAGFQPPTQPQAPAQPQQGFQPAAQAPAPATGAAPPWQGGRQQPAQGQPAAAPWQQGGNQPTPPWQK